MLTLTASSSTATVFPDAGGRLGQLDFGGGPLLRGPGPGLDWDAWGAYPLLPWSNRIPGGRLRFDGIDALLPVNWRDGTAIHGLSADVAWNVDAVGEASASLSVEVAQAPYEVRGEQHFNLDDGVLDLELAVVNLASQSVPVGLGIHPWFRAGAIRVPAAGRWPGEPLPTGVPVPVEGDDDLRDGGVPPLMDRCYTWLCGTTAEAPGVELCWSGPVTQIVVYTGEPGWVVIEPVTMANDGFRLAHSGASEHGVQVLAPGGRMAVRYRFERT